MSCKVEDCDKKLYAWGMCYMHYKRVKRHGSTERQRREMGTGTLTQHGYISIEHSGKAKYEHVLMAEKVLGRPLRGEERVHHMNGNGRDNKTPFNLVICPNEAYHQLLHRRMRALGYEGPRRTRYSPGAAG